MPSPYISISRPGSDLESDPGRFWIASILGLPPYGAHIGKKVFATILALCPLVTSLFGRK